MVFVDPRAGSGSGPGDLLPHLQRLNVACARSVVNLDAADATFIGNGPDGVDTLNVGIERKTMREILGGLRGGRVATELQLPELIEACSPGHAWLVVEGIWRCADDGLLEEYRQGGWHDVTLSTHKRGGKFMASELERHLITLQTHMGLKIMRTARIEHTARFLGDLHHQMTSKRWDEHTSHLGVQIPILQVPQLFRQRTAEEEIMLRRTRKLMCFAGLAQQRAASLAELGSVRELAEMMPKQLQAAEGVGKLTAESIHKEFRE